MFKDANGDVTSMQFVFNFNKDKRTVLDIGYETLVLDKKKLEELIEFLECALKNYWLDKLIVLVV